MIEVPPKVFASDILVTFGYAIDLDEVRKRYELKDPRLLESGFQPKSRQEMRYVDEYAEPSWKCAIEWKRAGATVVQIANLAHYLLLAKDCRGSVLLTCACDDLPESGLVQLGTDTVHVDNLVQEMKDTPVEIFDATSCLTSSIAEDIRATTGIYAIGSSEFPPPLGAAALSTLVAIYMRTSGRDYIQARRAVGPVPTEGSEVGTTKEGHSS